MSSPDSLLCLAEKIREVSLPASPPPAKNAFAMDTATPLGNIARRIAFSIEKASFAKLCDLVQGFRRAVGDPKSAPASPSQQLEQLMHLMAHDVLPSMLGSPKLSELFTFLKGPPSPAVASSVKWHFIQALEAVERNDLPKAVESLYTYFDCFGPAASIGEVKPAVHVGFSALAIASFLLRLRSEDAIPALHESVRLGLERNDSYLIALALYRFVTAALESGLLQIPYPLLSQLLTQAGVLAARRPPGTTPPASAAEQAAMHTLLKATIQLEWPELAPLQEVLATLTDTATRLALPASAAPHEATATVLSHQRRALRATVWARAGNSLLAETYWRASLPPHAQLPAQHRTAVEGQLARWEAEHGRLSEALESARARLSGPGTGLPALEPATRAALLLAAETTLAHRSLDEATRFAEQLRAFTPVDVLPTEYVHARRLEARVLLLRDRPAEAAALFTRTEAAVRTYWPHRGDLELDLAQFTLELATAYTRSGHPAAALPMVLHALAAAETAQVRGALHTEAMLALAEVMLLMGTRARCRAFVEAVLPQALQHGGHRLVARTWLTLARATLAEGASAPSLNAALQQLDRALTAATQASDDDQRADVYYLRARVLHQLGREQERNEAARLFKAATERRSQGETKPCHSNIRALPEQLSALVGIVKARGA